MTKVATRPLTTFFASALTVLLAFGRSSSLQQGGGTDIRQFYAAGATIWIVNTTMLEPKYCEVDYVNHTSYKYAFFERDYNKSGTKHKEILAGMYTRMDSATFNGMRVFQRNGTYYDMRVKDSAVENPHASCLKKFEELSRGEYITNLFNNSCRKSR
uniref:Lipocalin n=1 Tax=Rhipicephalus appendiculatus TaxID=34631 RepID=A0A131Z396_RHIAP